MLRLLQNRIREAVRGNDFNPRALAKVRPLAHLSGGAGVSAAVGLGDGIDTAPTVAPTDLPAFPAGGTPTDTYYRYLKWLSRWPLNPQVDLLTPDSRSYLASLRISPAYAKFILLAEYDKRFQIVERDDLALLYFTGTPFVSPHFFLRQDGVWRMALAAEVRNTHEHVGGEYTWAYHGTGDRYTQAFGDLLVTLKGYRRIGEGYRRIGDGDNRALSICGSY